MILVNIEKRRYCGCINCDACRGIGRINDYNLKKYIICNNCNGAGATNVCFEHAKKLGWLKDDDIKRHDYYLRINNGSK